MPTMGVMTYANGSEVLYRMKGMKKDEIENRT